MCPANLRGPRLLQALSRYHTLLRLIALNAPELVIVRSQALVDEALVRAGIDEVALAHMYPLYRLGHIELPYIEEN